MKKYYLIALVLFVFCFGFIQQQHLAVIAKKNTISAGNDYTADANCMGAFFMNVAGDELDRSGEGGTLTQTSGTIPTSATVPATYSGTSRVWVAGDSEYLAGGAADSTNITGADQDFSIVAWVNVGTCTAASIYSIVSKFDRGSDPIAQQYAIQIDGTDTDTFEIDVRIDGNVSTSTTTDLAAGTWYHIAVVYDDSDTGQEVKIYINASENATDSYSGGMTDATTANFAIGSEYNAGSATRPYDGLIDEVAIFDRVLSPAEVTEIYTYGIDGSNGIND